MTINPTLAEDQVTRELFPLPRPGEVFILKRENIYFQSGSRKAVCKATGLFMLSSQRFVFVAQRDKNKEDFGSFENPSFSDPLEAILKQEFQQPIFGCNYLELLVQSTEPAVTGDTNFPVYLYFYEGGAGTFLTVFFKFLSRCSVEEAHRMRKVSPVLRLNFVNNRHAFVDQSDPSIFYLQQPTGPARDVGGGSAPSSPSRRSGSGHAEVGHAGRFPQEAQLLQQQRQQQPHIGGGSEPTSSSANPGEGSGRTSRAGDEIEMNTWGGGDGGVIKQVGQ